MGAIWNRIFISIAIDNRILLRSFIIERWTEHDGVWRVIRIPTAMRRERPCFSRRKRKCIGIRIVEMDKVECISIGDCILNIIGRWTQWTECERTEQRKGKGQRQRTWKMKRG